MTLKNIIEKLGPMVFVKVIVDDNGNFNYEDMTHINDCVDCEVETISTEEDGTLVVTVNGNIDK